MHGDKAKWVPAHLGCNANLRVSPFTTVQVAGGVASGGFRFDKGGAYYLCYRFMYKQQLVEGLIPPTAYIPFKDIRVVAIGVTGATPNGTAVSCVSNVSILGGGFLSLQSLVTPPTLTCSFGGTVVNPVGITEDSVLPDSGNTSVKSETLKLHVGTKLEFTALSAFHAYDDSSLAVTSVFPGGGAYNLVANIYVGGTMLNYGAPRCRFGKPEENLYGNTGVWLNSTHIKCEKPRFPDSYRDSLGSYDLTVTPNGQCYAASKGSFTTYNALTDGVLLLGAPATSSVEIDITGEGYVALAGGLCFFKQIGLPAGTTPQTFAKPLSVQSSTLALLNTSCGDCQPAVCGFCFNQWTFC